MVPRGNFHCPERDSSYVDKMFFSVRDTSCVKEDKRDVMKAVVNSFPDSE